jgi:5-amino-6-(5-phospho-D-ribitylamino)uracil phosphatase
VTDSTIYVCDLDGTLLRSDGTLSDFSRRGLGQLFGAGVRLTVASARGAPAMRALLAGVPFELPVIELNGAFVSEWESGHHLVSNTLAPTEACTAVQAIIDTGVDPVLSSWDGSRDRVHFSARTNECNRWYVEEKEAYGDPRLTPCDELLSAAKREQVAQIATFAPDAEAMRLTGRLRDLVGPDAIVHSQSNSYRPGWTEILVQHRAAEKGAAIPALLEACDAVDAGIVACGDHLNDLGMFAVATHSIAPANAHPEVQEKATEIVGSNDEDGIVRYLLDHHVL